MKNERSNKFDYFTGGNKPENKKKNAFKKVWYWVKILIYVFIFGVTLTGCVQTFTLPTSSSAGSGLEFYLNEKDIAPRVSSFKVDDTAEIVENADKEPKITKLPQIIEKTGVNYFLDDKALIEKLRIQTEKNNGKYGEYNGLSTSIRVVKNDKEISPEAVYGENDKYIYRTNSELTYSPVLTFKPIYTIAKAIKSGANNTIEQVANLIQMDANDPEKITWVSGLSLIPTDLKDTSDAKRQADLLYARDILQLFYNQTFNDEKWTSIFNGKTPGDFYKTEIIDKLASLVPNVEVRITPVQRLALIEYARVLDEYTKGLGFLNTPLIDSPQNKYIENNSARYSFVQKTILVYAGETQKPITTWTEAWELGPFYGLIVYPFSLFVQTLRQSMPNLSGWATIFSLFVAVIIIKIITLAITFKSLVGQSIQEDLRGKKAQIEAKYEGFEKNKTMKMRKQQDLQKLYKRHNINPLDQFLSGIIAMPIFLAMWRVVQGIPEIKSTVWLGINFSSTSYQNLFAGEIQYLWILVVACAAQLVSQLLPRFLNRKKLKHRITIAESQALKKSEKTQRIVVIVFMVMTVLFSAGVQVYWTISAIFTIIQAYGIHRLKKTTWWRTKYSLKFK